MFKGTPGGGVDVLPEMLRAAATEARLKGTSLEESMTALIGLAHMTKEYNPEQIKKLVPAFAFLSASNPASLGGIERAASYAVPILQSGLDIDPLQTLLLGTALTRAGATNTKSGTWLRNMALAAMPGTSLMSQIAFKKHEEALGALGLVDKDDQPTWFTDGKPDLIKMLGIASQHAGEIPLTKRAAYEKQLFGAQGFGGFALLADPAVKQQVAALGAEMNSSEFKARYGNFMTDYAGGSPVQQTRQTWADLENVLMDLGQVALPPVLLGLRGLDVVLKEIDAALKAFPFLSNFISGPGLAANAYKAAGDIFGGISQWWNGSGGGSPTLSGGHGSSVLRARGSLAAVGLLGGRDAAPGAEAASVKDAEALVNASEVGDSAKLREYLRTGGVGMNPRDLAWCAGFVNATLGHEGIKGTGSLMAGSFFKWGHGVSAMDVHAGDVLVAKDGSHVGMAEGAVRMGPNGPEVLMIAGNERDPNYSAAPGRSQAGKVGERWVSLNNFVARRAYLRGEGSDGAASLPVPGTNGRYPGRPVPGSLPKDDDVDLDPSIHAHAKELHIHVTSILDGKKVAQSTQKHIVRRNQFTFGPSHADYGAIPQGVDSGSGSSVAA